MSKYYRANVCDIISLCLKGCCLFTIRIKGFVDCWSVQHLSSVACWHCNSLYRGRFYVWASGLCSLYRRIRYIEVLFHAFHYNFGWDIGNHSLSRTSLNRGSLNRGSTVLTELLITAKYAKHILKKSLAIVFKEPTVGSERPERTSREKERSWENAQ